MLLLFIHFSNSRIFPTHSSQSYPPCSAPLSRLCFALCLLIGCAAPAYAFDLIQAFEAAQQHSAKYAAAQYGYQAEIEKEAQARAPLLSQISANALY